MKQVKIFTDSNAHVIEIEINAWIIANTRQEFSIQDQLMCVHRGVIVISIWYTNTDITKNTK